MKTVFENGFMQAQVDDNGMFTFDRKKTQHGSVVVAFDKDGKIILIEENRAGVDVPIIGVVKGAADNGVETYVDIAERELMEELGIRADGILTSNIEAYALPAFTATRARVVMAYGCEVVDVPKLEVGESIKEYGRFTVQEVLTMICDGTLNDSESIMALMTTIVATGKLKE